MQVKTLIQEIERLSLRKRFTIIEQTLKSIKKDELKSHIFDDQNDNETINSIVSINEKSLAKDWLSDEDERWDKLL